MLKKTCAKPRFIIGFDPALNDAGWALLEDGLFTDGGILRGKKSQNLFDRAFSVPPPPLPQGTYVFSKETGQMPIGLFVGEVMAIYRQGKGDPNKLIPLIGVTFQIAAKINADLNYFPTPREWKGNVPKEIHNDRVLSKLSSKERFSLSQLGVPRGKLHNVIDAVGLAKWGWERF